MNAVAPEDTAVSFEEESVARDVLAIVQDLTAELHPAMPGVDKLGADASIERDFGLDSLARVELGLRIERALTTSLSDTALAESETVRDLARSLVGTVRFAPAAVALKPRPTVEREVVAAPASAATLLDALEWHAIEQPERTHILLADREAEPERITFGDLRNEAVAVAAGLKSRGIRPGETVAIMLPTGREFFAAFYGALYAQAVPVPLYPPARPSQIETHLRRVAGILANCEARILLTFERAKRLAHLLRSLGTRLEIIVDVAEVAEAQVAWPAPPLTPRDTAFLQYTSGSTGQPKGVVLTHRNLLSNLDAMQRVTRVTSADLFVSWLPLYHDMGLIGACFGALVIGFPLVLMSPFAFLSRPVRWLRAIDWHRATITAAPNFAYELCLNKIEEKELHGLDLSSLRLAFNGAEAVSAQTLERFAARFAPYGLRREALMPVYGLAESAVGLTFPPVGRGMLIDRIARDRFLQSGIASTAPEAGPMPLSIVSCGAVLPGHLIRIVDEGGAALPERTQGRIEFQGPSATSGYFHNPRETARLFDGEWLDTGDLGYQAEGELYVTGRARDIIIRGGHNIHPQELEEAVAQLPGVRKGGVAVFPAIDRRSGTERIIVLAETREERPAAPAELISSINRLAVDLIGVPVDEVVLALPRTVLKTSSGKLRRAACRDAYERGELGAAARPPWLQLTRLAYRALATRSGRAARRSIAIAWSLRAWLVGACLAPLFWLAVVLTPGLARRRRVGAALVRLALRLCSVSFRVRKPTHAAPGPQVFVSNHASYLDGLLVMAALPPDVTFVAKREFVGSFVIGRFLERVGCVFVERFDVHEAATGARELQARLEAGESLVVFVEGTFRRDSGLLPFHMGAFSAASAARADVVPVAICGTRSMLPDGARLPRPAAIEVVIGEPLTPEDASWRSAVKLRRDARQHILRHVREPDLEQIPVRAIA
jgi:1-acyl-sn-glycerol-3-phosphate acyltransferase